MNNVKYSVTSVRGMDSQKGQLFHKENWCSKKYAKWKDDEAGIF